MSAYESVPFRDRRAAGQLLGERLLRLADADPVVLALPRGGVPVAYEIARALDAPLDVVVVRKLGVPFQPELGMGAIGEGGVRVLNPEIMNSLRITDSDVEHVERRERAELERRAQSFRGAAPMFPLTDRLVIIVDDGLATGSTARAAILVARAHGADRVVLAIPVAPPDTVMELSHVADEVVCLATPEPFTAIGQWYVDFRQTSDAEVVELLSSARSPRA